MHAFSYVIDLVNFFLNGTSRAIRRCMAILQRCTDRCVVIVQTDRWQTHRSSAILRVSHSFMHLYVCLFIQLSIQALFFIYTQQPSIVQYSLTIRIGADA